MSSPAILVIGTLDTKGAEIGYVRDRIEALGATAIVLDSGILREPISGRVADISREEVALAAGSSIDAAYSEPSSRMMLSALSVAPRGVFTSWAMPAVRRPSVASRSARMRLAWFVSSCW